jgi:hypothetical protein
MDFSSKPRFPRLLFSFAVGLGVFDAALDTAVWAECNSMSVAHYRNNFSWHAFFLLFWEGAIAADQARGGVSAAVMAITLAKTQAGNRP